MNIPDNTEVEYFLLKANGEQTGTYSVDQVKAMLASGYIEQNTLYWKEGMTGWRSVTRIDEPIDPSEILTTTPETIRTVKIPKPPPAPSKPLPTWLFYAVPVALITLVLVTSSGNIPTDSTTPDTTSPKVSVPVETHPSLGKITLAGKNTYVLLEQPTIKSFEADMKNSPVVTELRHRIQQTTDPLSLQSLTIGVNNEQARHFETIEQQYLRNRQAQIIPPDTYDIVGFLDENGDTTSSRKSSGWVAITYNGFTVYACENFDSIPSTP
jgi:hypothetical protein